MVRSGGVVVSGVWWVGVDMLLPALTDTLKTPFVTVPAGIY